MPGRARAGVTQQAGNMLTWSLCCHIKHSGSGNNSELNNEIVKLDSELAVKL